MAKDLIRAEADKGDLTAPIPTNIAEDEIKIAADIEGKVCVHAKGKPAMVVAGGFCLAVIAGVVAMAKKVPVEKLTKLIR